MQTQTQRKTRELAAFLQRAQNARTLVQVTRHRLERAPARSVGYVVGLGSELVMLHRLSDRIDLDGFEILRLRDVTAFREDFAERAFYTYALEMKREEARAPTGVDLTDIASAVRSVDESQSLVVIHREVLAPDEAAVGKVRATLSSGVRLHWMTPTAEWAEDETLYRYASITRIEFGGEYEETLAAVAKRCNPLPGNSSTAP